MTGQLRDVMREWADEVEVPHDLADRALRRRARRPWVYGAVAVATAMVVAVVAVLAPEPEKTVKPATEITLPARPSPAPTDVRADLESVPPKKMIAAGIYAISAYWTEHTEKYGGKLEGLRRVWSLLDPRTDTYEQTGYAWVDVAPGLQVAAVVEGDQMGRRIGVLDMNTRQFLTWFDLDQQVASVRWSSDGTRLLATAYTEYPERWRRINKNQVNTIPTPRIGYYVIDVPNRKTAYHPLGDGSSDITGGGSRLDLHWSQDGTLIWQGSSRGRGRDYYTPDGQARPAPKEDYSDGGVTSLSPNGKLSLGQAGLPTKITDVATGAVAGTQQALQLHAWADDDNVIALGCARECDNEFDAAIVLTSVDGAKTTQLSGYQDNRKEGAWFWTLTPR